MRVNVCAWLHAGVRHCVSANVSVSWVFVVLEGTTDFFNDAVDYRTA